MPAWLLCWDPGLSPLSGFDESASGGEGPYAIFEPRELAFTMRPGREYTFNVGIWVFTDRTPGVGGGLLNPNSREIFSH
jgi:hypothetical protein